MTIRVRFGSEYAQFKDGTSREAIYKVRDEWEELGRNLGAVFQRRELHGLSTNPDFLSLPRIDRHAAFNEKAQNGPFWQTLAPEERRILRGIVVDRDEANPEEALNYWDAPFSKGEASIWDMIEGAGALGFFPGGKSKAAQDAASTIAELGRGLQRSTPKVMAGIGAGAATLADSFTGYIETNPGIPLGPQGHFYSNPLFQTDPARKAHQASGELADAAREIAIDASVGTMVTTEPRKYATFGEGLEEGGVAGLAQAGAAMVGEQVPVMGAIAGASMVPGVGLGLGAGVAASLQTGSILEDMEREGIRGDDAQTIASVVGVLTGAMEYLPIGRLMNRSPVIATTWKRWLAGKGLQALKQGGEEALTEFGQTGLEAAASDFVRMHRDELDTVEAWTTPEGLRETVGDALQAAVEGGFIGMLMGPLGGGAGRVTPEPQARPTAAEIAQQADTGPRVPPMEPMAPIPVTQPGIRPDEIVAPPGPVQPGGEPTLPLPVGPEGAATLPRRGWSEEQEQKARFNYAPDWLKSDMPGMEAFTRGDIDEDAYAHIIEVAEEAGIPQPEADAQLDDAKDRAINFLSGGMLQPEQEPLAVVHPREPMEAPPVQPGATPLIEEGRPAIPGAVAPELEGIPPVQREAVPLMEGDPLVSPADVAARPLTPPRPFPVREVVEPTAPLEGPVEPEEGQAGIEPAGAVPAEPVGEAPPAGEVAPVISEAKWHFGETGGGFTIKVAATGVVDRANFTEAAKNELSGDESGYIQTDGDLTNQEGPTRGKWLRVRTIFLAQELRRAGVAEELYKLAAREAVANGYEGIVSTPTFRKEAATKSWQRIESAEQHGEEFYLRGDVEAKTTAPPTEPIEAGQPITEEEFNQLTDEARAAESGYKTTFKPKLKTKLTPKEYAPAVGAALAGKEGVVLTREKVRQAVVDLTGFKPETVSQAKIDQETDALVDLGVFEAVDDEFRVLPGRIDSEGVAVDSSGLRYGKERASVHAEIANETIESDREEFDRQHDFLKTLKGSVQVWQKNTTTGEWFIPEENAEINETFRAPKPTGAPLSGTAAQLKATEVGTDQVRESAIEAGILTEQSTVDDAVALLSRPGKWNMGLGLKPKKALIKDFMSLEDTRRAKAMDLSIDAVTKEVAKGQTLAPVAPPTAPQKADLKKAFTGWAVRQLRPGLFRLTRKGQPITHVQFSSRKPSRADIETAAKGHGIPFEEAEAGIRAGELAIKGSYSFDDINGTHLVSLYLPHATPKTVFEEAFHYVFHNVLNSGQRQQLLKVYDTEESAAGVYKKYAANEVEVKGVAAKIFAILQDFARRMLRSNNVDAAAAAALMKKIASGEIFAQEGRYFTGTDASGAIPLRVFANTVLNAEEAAKEAMAARKLKPEEFTEAVENAKKEIGFSFVDRGDGATMFELERPADVPEEHHPGLVLPEETQREQLTNRAENFWFNKLAPIRVIQEKLTSVGEDFESIFNAYIKAQNFQARSGALLDWVDENLFKPFRDDVAASGVNLMDFDLFRMAAHALERNVKLRDTHITKPTLISEKKIEKLGKKPLSPGAKVRSIDKGNVGTVVAVHKKMGKAEVLFISKDGKRRATRLIPMAKLERESVAREKDKIAEIRRMVAADETPHSGMTDEHARGVLEELRGLGMVNWTGELGPNTTYTGDMGRLSRRFSQIVHWKEETLFKAGLLSKAELKKWRDYKHYAPMRGKDPDIMDIIHGGRRMPIPEVEIYGGKLWNRSLARTARALGIDKHIHVPNVGKGYNPGRRPAAHRALGRRSFPTHSATIELMTDTMDAAIRGERNRVAKSVWNLVNLVKDAEDINGEKLFEIDRPDSHLVWDEKTGTVKEKIDGLSVTKENVYNVWIDGELHYIRHVSPDMAEFISALNNLQGGSEMAAVWRTASAINRYISKMATSRNPAFAIPNAVADSIMATIRLAGDKRFEGFGVNETMKRAPKAWKTLAEYARRQTKGTLDEMDSEARARVEAFKLAGGETAFWMIPNLQAQMKTLQAKLEEARGDDPLALRWGKTVIHFLEDYNAAIEGTMRFSVFERALELGLSKDQAAKLARNITVDFTQQGAVAPSLGAAYVFANASLQGNLTVAKAVKDNKQIQKMMMASVGMAFTHAVGMRFFGGEDPEDGIPWWDKIPSHLKSRHLIIMSPFGDGKYARIRLPWGFNIFWAIGTHSSDAFWGPKSPGEATMNILSAGMSAFNPIGDNDLSTLQGWGQLVSPAWADPVTDVMLNRTFWGGPIAPEGTKYKKSQQYGEEAASPDYNRYFHSVSKTSKAIAAALYKHTGLDISPENIDYSVASIFGGLGDTVNRTVDLALKMSQRQALVARDFPILKSFFGDESKAFAPQMYRANMGDFWYKKETYDGLKKSDPKSAAEFYKRHYEVLSLESIVKATEKRIRDLKKMDAKSSDSRMQREFKLFNRRFNTVETQTLKRRVKER